jgi:hypothetical protein
MATAATQERAIVAGLSDRLGWEAAVELERGTDLPPALGVSQPVADSGSGTVLVLDGRLGHSVPTVVLLGADFVRWGAGATWDGAVRRALYGDDGNPSVDLELVAMTEMLGTRGLGVVAVDLDTPLLRRAGIVRTSVQLIAANVLGR